MGNRIKKSPLKCDKCENCEEHKETLRKCGHVVCHDCMIEHLDNITSAKVHCPVKNCSKLISDGIIRKFLSNNQIESYDRFCWPSNIAKCIIKDCPFIIATDKDDKGHFVCGCCGQPNCRSCKRIHDVNIHCSQVKNYNQKEFEVAAHEKIIKFRKDLLLTQLDSEDLIPNDAKFDCPICSSFILPRAGVSLRNCMDTFCKSCLTKYVSGVDHINNINCPLPACGRPLTERECIKVIGSDKYHRLNLSIIKPSMYNCQTPECKGMWDFGDYTGKHKCPFCFHFNCGACKVIHEGQSCEVFRTTTRYIEDQMFRNNLKERKHITCQNCKVIIIKSKGCNALRCPGCRLQVCAYSGKEIGPKGCKCTKSKRCFPGCSPGCIPEGKSPYEKGLYEYFFNN